MSNREEFEISHHEFSMREDCQTGETGLKHYKTMLVCKSQGDELALCGGDLSDTHTRLLCLAFLA